VENIILTTFNDAVHKVTISDDGSYTAYSKEYDEHYHSTKDGALNESLTKHVIPTFKLKQNLHEIKILDICFGLGFNTLATLYYRKLYNIDTKIYIYSPELDAKLIESLKNFPYPQEFDEFKKIIDSLVDKNIYEDENTYIELYVGDAREYIKNMQGFDIVYQDAFSPSSNPMLWTKEYFGDIASLMKQDGVLSTYSIALKTRLALHENDFNVYINSGEDIRDATLASLSEVVTLKKVDILHKISCNPQVTSLRDADI